MIFAIDPGTTQSGYVLFDGAAVLESGVAPNHDVLSLVEIKGRYMVPTLAIEMIDNQGMPVGRETFETVRWVGRFQQAWREPEAVRFIYRREVKLHLCGSARAKDPNIRQALIDLIGAPGTKRAKGPTFGVKSHAWQALAVAVVAEATA